MLADPGEVVGAEAGAGDDVEVVLGEPRHGEVALDAAARVEQLRVGEPAGRLVDVVGADPVERALRILAGQLVFGEGRLVEDADRLAHVRGAPRRPARTSSAGPSNRRRCGSTPSGANQFGRSQPSFEPNTARCAFSRS